MNKYRLIAGVYVDKESKRYSDSAIVSSNLELNKLFKGQFIKLDLDNAPEPMLAKGGKSSASKVYDVTAKFKSAIAAGLVVSKKGKLFSVCRLSDASSTAINQNDIDSPQDVNAFVETV